MKTEVSRPQKELWPGITKADLAAHYQRVAPRMLPHLDGRPLTLVRAPDGVGAGRFFQKDAHHMPRGLERCKVKPDLRHVMADTPDDLVALANQGCVELHGWVSRCRTPDQPDRVVFDLDPEGLDQWPDVKEAAATLCDLLIRRGAAPHPLLTGSRGLHVVVPLVPDADIDAVNAFADAVARVMVRHDARLTMEIRKNKRQGRIFVDTLRNRRNQTSIMPYSTRAVEEGTYALPVRVEDLAGDIHPRMGRINADLPPDAWPAFFEQAVPLSRLS